MDTQATQQPKRDTSKAREASLATFARRRVARALAELEAQGYRVTLDPPLVEEKS